MVKSKSLIVAGADATDGARRALRRAARIAAATGARLLVVHVIPHPVVAVFAPMPEGWLTSPPPEMAAEERATVIAAGHDAARRFAAATDLPGAEAAVRVGRPHQVLADVARRRRASLLVLGVHAPLVPHEQFLLGSTAERAVRAGPTPVLLARHDGDAPYRRVLVPMDVGDQSLSVLRLVAENFPDVPCDLVHYVPVSEGDESRERHEARAAAMHGLALAAGLDPATTRVRVFAGSPRESILAEIAIRGPDLVAMATHARSGVSRVLLGSVADYVIHASPTDVLVVPPRRSAA